ncbi:MAG: isoamylase early set domain-containing protein [Bacteroidales bacterium]|nr:isoamylase early set domain-containing protein [Bacteroidales bacterium]
MARTKKTETAEKAPATKKAAAPKAGKSAGKSAKVAVLLQLTNEEAQNANEVAVAGEFNNWDKEAIKMTKTIGGFEATIELKKGTYQFKYVLDGEKWINDPTRKVVDDGQGNQNSVIEL